MLCLELKPVAFFFFVYVCGDVLGFLYDIYVHICCEIKLLVINSISDFSFEALCLLCLGCYFLSSIRPA